MQLAFDRDKGYLPAVLQALRVPKESQIAVFSPTSFQADKINAQNPRAIYSTTASPSDGSAAD